MLNTVTFSMDRACQLHALLETWERFVTGGGWPTVLWKATRPEYEKGYAQVQERFPGVNWRREGRNCRADTLNAIDPRNAYTMFLVDDQIVRRPLQVDGFLVEPLLNSFVLGISLRLSPQINFYYSGNRPSPPPAYLDRDGWLYWDWREADGDWNYPMSIDCTIFRTSQLLVHVRNIPEWCRPNELEAAMAANPMPQSVMACQREHYFINIPAHLVQDVFPNNRTCGGPQPLELNNRYLAGEVIDTAHLVAIENRSCHTPAIYQFKPWDPSR